MFFISKSPWPLTISLILMSFFMNLIIFMNFKFSFGLILGFILIILSLFCWWSDVVLESKDSGFHNFYVENMTIFSMISFIVSEVFFFLSFFWTFFHYMFSPEIFTGSMWPSVGIFSIYYLGLPLLNSLFLISSGLTITWSHYMLMSNNFESCKFGLMLTLILGVLFIFCQIFEYKFSLFSFSDSIFGSIFFISTGFHGIHVFIGSLFIFIMLIRLNFNHFSKGHFLGFEFSIWYWHFVDVVWLYLYMSFYWFGS